jgi:transketolase
VTDTSHSNTGLITLKEQIIRAAAAAKEGHIASALSILDILWVLYDKVLRIDPKKPLAESRDRFVLSKGHGCLALYAVLASKGFFPSAELENFAAYNNSLGGHPDCNKVPGVEASTGSLGHGLPIAVGMALGLKVKGSASKVFCLIGDGESNEGTIWEAALLANQYGLNNLICIVDYNHSTDRALRMGDIAAKLSAFGWSATVINGHDHAQLLGELTKTNDSPRVVVADTIKGHGCAPMENDHSWHHRAPKPDEIANLLSQLS